MKGSKQEATAVSVDDPDEVVRVIVIDGSSFTFIDSMGLQTLPAVSIYLNTLRHRHAENKLSLDILQINLCWHSFI